SGSWCNAARARRIWQTNLSNPHSSQYLPHGFDKQPHITFGRARQDAVAQTADPAVALGFAQRRQVARQTTLQLRALKQEQRRIEIALHKAAWEQLKRFAQIPTIIHANTGELACGKERRAQVCR